MTPMPDTTLTSAVNELKTHQTQLDMDGVMVGVSRQALYIVLEALARAGLEAGKAEEWLPIETAKQDGTRYFLNMPATTNSPPWQSQGFWSTQYGGGWRAMDSVGLRHVEPTLYCPLPAPPAIRALPLTGGDKP